MIDIKRKKNERVRMNINQMIKQLPTITGLFLSNMSMYL